MCGILGIAGRKIDEGTVRAWAETMQHRGPDAAGTYSWRHGTFAHRRLKILDTSSASDQPFLDPYGQAAIVFNGEIYNHRALRAELERSGRVFRTKCDTEVLLAGYLEWGTAVVDRLNGMFAFAIHDTRDGSVFIARDRLGKKPLFLASLPRGGLLFSSELKPILASGLIDTAIDHEAILDFVHLNYVLSPKTPLCAIKQLPPRIAVCGKRAPSDSGSIGAWRMSFAEDPSKGGATKFSSISSSRCWRTRRAFASTATFRSERFCRAASTAPQLSG